MSNCPPSSTITTHSRPNGHMEPPVGNYDHDLSQYPYPVHNPAFLYSQGQTNGTPMGPQTHSNTHSFRPSVQGVMTHTSGNDVNATLYAPFDAQTQYNASRASDYPQMPFAHGVPSNGDQSFGQPSTNPNHGSHSSTLFTNLHPTVEVQSTNIVGPDTVPPALSELEDGELDDEEAGKATSQSRASTMTPSGVSKHLRYADIDSMKIEFSHRAANASDQPLPGLNQDSLASPNPQESSTSQPQQYLMPNGFTGTYNDSKLPRTTESTSVQHQQAIKTSDQEPGELNQPLLDEKTEEAKQALLDLHLQGFSFNRIVNAGINPSVLQRLYNKIKVPVTGSSDLVQRKLINPGVIDMPTESATDRAHDQHSELPQKRSEGDILGNDTPRHLKTEEIKFNGQPTLEVARNEGKSLENQASLAKSLNSLNVNPLGKASGIKAGGTKILDRKEYIARMLAAKAGKPAVSASINVSSQTPTIPDTGVYAPVRSSAIATPNVPTTVSQVPSKMVDTAPETQKEDSDMEAKRKAQTDLARQKIEALRFRESFIQQARSANISDSMSNSQQDPARGVTNVPAEKYAPASQPLPSRQSSYFSPASQKPPFSIPGLFMTSDSPNLSKPPTSEDSAVLTQGVGDATFGSSQEGAVPQAIDSAESPTVNKTAGLPENSLGLNSALPATISATTLSNRKRQRASDFIDSPFTKVKKPLGQQEDASVIIDISDDEVSNDISEDEYLETASRQDSLLRKSLVTASGNNRKNPPQSLPPLTDPPQRKKSVMMTPPAAGQSSDFNGLKSKEMEIEVMNRKIAELEQRIATKAKQTTSRSHSPRTSSRVTISPSPGRASQQISNPPNVPLTCVDSSNGDVTRTKKREPFTALSETIETAAAEQLNAVQQLEQVERAKAEAERSLAAEITLASAADQLLMPEEKLQIQQADERTKSWREEQRSTDNKHERVQAEEEQHLEESQSRQMRGGETRNLDQEEADQYSQQKQTTQGAQQAYLQEKERKKTLDDQRQARKSEIESGLPILDAEVEKTRIRIESLQQEIASLETQLQKGVEGRQGLIEELQILSQSRETLPGPMDLDSCDINEVTKQLKGTEKSPAVTKSPASVETAPDLEPSRSSGTLGEVHEKDVSMRTTEVRISDGEVEEDIMDISRSDLDDAELSLYSPKAELHDISNSVDDDENYEPPSEISIAKRQEQYPDAILLSQDLEIAMANPPDQTQKRPSSNLTAGPIEKPTSGEPSPAASVKMSSDEQSPRSLSDSPSLANASDPDDYEPPEPASLGHEIPQSTHMASVDTETTFSPRNIDRPDFIAHASSDLVSAFDEQVPKPESNCKRGYYIPYESPLKQFKSFRYHPRYLEEVSSGFRSLTYSHTINPDIPLCRYELDGVCNDDACQSQHLRNVGLSGALIEA